MIKSLLSRVKLSYGASCSYALPTLYTNNAHKMQVKVG